MISKIDIMTLFEEDLERPLIIMDIMNALEVPQGEVGVVDGLMDELASEGKLIRTKKGKFAPPEFFNIYVGKVQVTQKGFGFLIPDKKEMKDIFIPASELHSAMNGDRVMVKLTKKGNGDRRSEGTVIDIIERANMKVVGTYTKSQNFGFVIPDEKRIRSDIYVSHRDNLNAEEGDKVICEITKFPEDRRNPEGKIVEVLGKKGDLGVDIVSVIRKYGLPEAFSKKVDAEADKIPQEIPMDVIKRRTDLRDELIVTIDGIDAMDLDDAISLEKMDNGNYYLGVHIADVTHYVREGSKLDDEAIKRGTSVYLIDRVIPMLPKQLSNGICSLNPDVERLTLSVFMEVDKNGDVVNHDIKETVIQSKARLNYTDVSNVLEDKIDDELRDKYEHLFDFFRLMEEVALILRKRRDKRGAIDFNFAESKIMLDESGKPTEIKKADRRISNRIIEEFMLLANETVSEHFFWLEIPFVYRIHETPTEEKIQRFNKFIYNFGYKIKGSTEEVHPKAIQNLLSEIEGKKEEHIISKMMLRSLQQAKYSPSNEGHFGLAAKYYSHYTSPIRRYPDLQIHRIIKEHLNGQLTNDRMKQLTSIVDEISKISSERERLAEQAERDVDDMKMAEYMSERIGEEYDGMVSSVVNFGMFIELENTVEGLVRVQDMMDDYYIYDEDNLQYIGERTKKTYKIGDSVKIRVEKVDIDNREIDFIILD